MFNYFRPSTFRKSPIKNGLVTLVRQSKLLKKNGNSKLFIGLDTRKNHGQLICVLTYLIINILPSNLNLPLSINNLKAIHIPTETDDFIKCLNVNATALSSKKESSRTGGTYHVR